MVETRTEMATNKAKKVHIVQIAYGCINHNIDNSRFKKYFLANNWEVVGSPAEADLILINSCGLTDQSEDNSINTIKQLQSKFGKGRKIVVYGCLPAMNPKRLKKVFNGPCFDFLHKDKIDRIINAKTKFNLVTCYCVDPDYNTFILQGKNGGYHVRRWTSFKLHKIEDEIGKFGFNSFPILRKFCKKLRTTDYFTIIIGSGCRHKCSYCRIRKAKGRLRSIPTHEVLKAFKEGLHEGYQNFELVADDLGAFGQDCGEDFVKLLRLIIKEKGTYHINLYHFYPTDLTDRFDDFKSLFKSGKFSSLSITLQSGSERILKLMNREYDLELMKRRIRELRACAQNMQINTHIMVGFPSESEDDFMDTVKLLDDVEFSHVGVFQYTERPDVCSYYLPDKVPAQIIANRFRRLQKRVLRKNLASVLKDTLKLGLV